MAVLASQLSATTRSRMSSLRRTIRRLSLADHEGAAESLLAQGGDQRLGVARARDLLDQHGVERRAGLLAKTHGLIAGLVQLPLDALRLRRGHERPELDREARAGRWT